MKTQMRVQKILMLISLVVSALVFVFALIFMTGGLANVYRFIDTTNGQDYIHCSKFVSTSQSFVSTLVAFGVVMVVLVAAMYLMACNSRRKYYITNYIAIAVFVVFALVVAVYLVIMVATLMNLYQNDILWKSGEGEKITRVVEIIVKDPITGEDKVEGYETLILATNYADQSRFYPDYVLDPNQTYNFILGFVLFVIIIADVVCVTLCTVWKFLLIKGEKKLLATTAPVTENVVAAEASETVANAVTEDFVENPVKEEE